MTAEQSGTASDDVILRHRVAALRKNLDEVKRIRGSVSDRRTELDRLAEFFDDMGVTRRLRRLQESIESSIGDVDELVKSLRLPPDVRDDVLSPLETARKLVEGLRLQFSEAQATVRDIGSRRLTLVDFDDHMDLVFNARESANLQRQIENLEAELEGRELPHPEEADRVPGEASSGWDRYQATLRHSGEELFGEYVDFLGGWALRSTGVAQDICAIADDLIQRFYWVGSGELWHSMAVPARRDATAWTLARIIRLGFPEWTIWAVPLSAHEFGRVVLRLNDYWRDDYLQRESELERRHLEDCLADAFATYAMGPAYAYASLLLRFEPLDYRRHPAAAKAEEERRSTDNERVHVVLKMLERMNQGQAFNGVRNGLEAIWRRSLSQAGVSFELAPEANETLERWTESMWRFLRDQGVKVEYEAKFFQQVMGWKPLTDPDFQLPSDDVRDLLNAAWHQRMRDPSLSPANEDALAEAAINLWRQSTAAKSGGSPWGTTKGRGGR